MNSNERARRGKDHSDKDQRSTIKNQLQNLEKVAAAAPPETEFEYSFMVKRPVAPVSATKADLPQSEVR